MPNGDTPNLGRAFLTPFILRRQAQTAERELMLKLLTPVAVQQKQHEDNLQFKYFSETERSRREQANIEENRKTERIIQGMKTDRDIEVQGMKDRIDLLELQAKEEEEKFIKFGGKLLRKDGLETVLEEEPGISEADKVRLDDLEKDIDAKRRKIVDAESELGQQQGSVQSILARHGGKEPKKGLELTSLQSARKKVNVLSSQLTTLKADTSAIKRQRDAILTGGQPRTGVAEEVTRELPFEQHAEFFSAKVPGTEVTFGEVFRRQRDDPEGGLSVDEFVQKARENPKYSHLVD